MVYKREHRCALIRQSQPETVNCPKEIDSDFFSKISKIPSFLIKSHVFALKQLPIVNLSEHPLTLWNVSWTLLVVLC